MFRLSRWQEIEMIERTIRNAHAIRTENSIRIPYQVEGSDKWECVKFTGKTEIARLYKECGLIDAYEEDGSVLYKSEDASFIDRNGCITWFSKCVPVSLDSIKLEQHHIIHRCAIREWSRVNRIMCKVVNMIDNYLIRA